MRIEPLPVPTGPAVLELLPRLALALEGGHPILPYAAAGPPLPEPPPSAPPDLAVVVGTSGSTGTPKRALLSARSMRASVYATHERLGGPGQWLLALPAHHIAGLQVLFRSLVGGVHPVVLGASPLGPPTMPFVEASAALEPGLRHYTALVPTQLVQLLDDPRGLRALEGFDAVLIGGAALAPHVRARAERAGVRVVATYGMSETASGCVYDGRPLAGTEIAFDDDLRIHIGGDMVAHGYLGRPDLTNAAFGVDEDGVRWFRSDDFGHLDDTGRLRIDARVDDLINTGGLKVAPRLVEEAIAEHIVGVREVVVVGVPDPHWGEAVSALVVLDPQGLLRDLTAADVRAALRGILPDHALPHRLRTATEIPQRGPGKPDRRAVAALMGE